MANRFAIAVGAACLVLIGCDDSSGPSGPTPPGSVRIAYLGSTTRRSDLPPSAQACVNGVGPTHIHPSWRSFAGIPLQPVPPNRYEIVFTDVPFDTRVTFRINDQNSCDQNRTGAVTSNVLVNDVRLLQNATTPGNGDEPGFAFSVGANGVVTQ